MADSKEFTSLVDYSKKVEETEGLPEPPDGEMVMTEAPLDKVADFESLDDYSKSHPAAEAPPEPEFAAAAPEEGGTDFPTSPEQAEGPGGSQAMDFSPAPTHPNVAAGDFAAAELSGAVTGAMDENPLGAEGTDAKVPFQPQSAPEFLPEEASAAQFVPPPPQAEAEPPTEAPDLALTPPPAAEEEAPALPPPVEFAPSDDGAPSDERAPLPEARASARPAAPAPSARSKPPSMAEIRAYSEGSPVSRTQAPAAYPFTLRIDGPLTDEEKEKLLDLLNRHQFGIREVDLEPQLAANRILIPRISEYAGVLLIQNLRTVAAKITFGPSDSVFASEATREDDLESASRSALEQSSYVYSHAIHPADQLPISQDEHYPAEVADPGVLQALDVLSASAYLHSKTVEADHSSEYQDLLERLQREIRYKAYLRGARALTHFKVQLAQLGTPTDYRLTVLATAMGPASSGKPPRRPPPRNPGA